MTKHKGVSPLPTQHTVETMADVLDQHQCWLEAQEQQLYEFFTLDYRHYSDPILTDKPDEMANELSRDWRVHVEEVGYEVAMET